MEKEHEIMIKLAKQVIQAVYDDVAWKQAVAAAVATAPIAVKASDITAFVEMMTR
jgi:hypothetical protein